MDKKTTLVLIGLMLTSCILASTLRYTIYANFGERVYSTSPLEINVMSDKEVYSIGENVQIYGNLTFYGEPLPDRLVALEIDSSESYPFIFRTLSTGTNLTGSWKIEVIRVFVGDEVGNQLFSVKRGNTVCVWVVFQNNFDASVQTTIAFTIFDANNAPMFAAAPIEYLVPPGGPYNMSCPWIVPTDAQLGNAEICASAFSKMPRDAGISYCPEKSETFIIEVATAMSTTVSTSQSFYQMSITGNYNYTFTLPTKGLRLGNYTVSVAANYKGLWEAFPASNTTKFKVVLLGDVNSDGKVDIKDIVLLVKAFGSYPGQPNWNPNADFNNDFKVDIKDMVLLIKHFGEHI